MVENIKDCERIHLFRDISREEIEKMFRCSKTVERSFEDGSYVFRQGETPKNLFLILEGSVMISKDFASGKRDVLFVVGQGDVFGEMYLFADARTYWYDAIAQGKVKLLEIPWEFFLLFLQQRLRTSPYDHQKYVGNTVGKKFCDDQKAPSAVGDNAA